LPIYGISTKKDDDLLDPWVNTYYTTVASLDSAESVAQALLLAERSIHSTIVDILKAHVWQVGSPGVFLDTGASAAGLLDATDPLPRWFTAEVNLLAYGSYPGWKRFRGRFSKGYYEDGLWTSAFLTAAEDYTDQLDELPATLCTRSGVNFGGSTLNARPKNLQEHKAWYNRST